MIYRVISTTLDNIPARPYASSVLALNEPSVGLARSSSATDPAGDGNSTKPEHNTTFPKRLFICSQARQPPSAPSSFLPLIFLT